jgi:hypothetical protein
MLTSQRKQTIEKFPILLYREPQVLGGRSGFCAQAFLDLRALIPQALVDLFHGRRHEGMRLFDCLPRIIYEGRLQGSPMFPEFFHLSL